MLLSGEEFRAKGKRIKLVVSDVDGVLTDGSVILDADGREIKRFNILDGFAIRAWLQAGSSFAVLSGRESLAVTRRCQELEIPHVLQGKGDKVPSYERLLDELSLQPEEVCFVGDDLPDLPLILRSGIGATVVNGAPEVQAHANWISTVRGGQGAVRELLVALLQTQGRWQAILERYLAQSR